jgi:hypothetical protein
MLLSTLAKLVFKEIQKPHNICFDLLRISYLTHYSLYLHALRLVLVSSDGGTRIVYRV